jgi:hypothetical protein
MGTVPAVPSELRDRIDAVLAARDRAFPRRDPANDAAMHATLAEYVERLKCARWDRFVPDAERVAQVMAIADDPVVVCGFMKSGTTLLLELLDGHPELIVLPGDRHMMNPREDERRRLARDAYWIPALVNSRGQAPYWFLGADDAHYVEFARYLEHALGALPADARGRFLAFVVAIHCANPRRAPHPRAWVEKTPENERHADRIVRWFPRARFIHLVRHPLENLASLKLLFRQRADMGWKPWSVGTTAWKLARSIRLAEENRRRLGPERYLVVRYEDLADTEPRMRDVARFLGIAWDAALLRPTLNGVASPPNSMRRDRLGVRGRVTIPAPGTWRSELTRAERLVARAVLARSVRRWASL